MTVTSKCGRTQCKFDIFVVLLQRLYRKCFQWHFLSKFGPNCNVKRDIFQQAASDVLQLFFSSGLYRKCLLDFCLKMHCSKGVLNLLWRLLLFTLVNKVHTRRRCPEYPLPEQWLCSRRHSLYVVCRSHTSLWNISPVGTAHRQSPHPSHQSHRSVKHTHIHIFG